MFEFALFCKAEELHFVSILRYCSQYSKHKQTVWNPVISSSELLPLLAVLESRNPMLNAFTAKIQLNPAL